MHYIQMLSLLFKCTVCLNKSVMKTSYDIQPFKFLDFNKLKKYNDTIKSYKKQVCATLMFMYNLLCCI